MYTIFIDNNKGQTYSSYRSKPKKVLLKNVFWDSITNLRLFPFPLALLRSAKEEQFNRNNCDANDKIISTVMDFVCDDPDTLKYN